MKELFRPLSKVELTGNTFTASQKDVINYSKNLPPTEATYLVRVNADLLKSGADSIIFNVPGAKPVTYKTTKVTKFESGNFIWHGKPSLESGIPEIFDLEFNVSHSEIRGKFRIDISDYKYRIEPVGDGVHIIMKQNIKKIPIIRSDDTYDKAPRRDNDVSSPHSTNLNGPFMIDVAQKHILKRCEKEKIFFFLATKFYALDRLNTEIKTEI